MPANPRSSNWVILLATLAVVLAYVVLGYLPLRRSIAQLDEQLAQEQQFVEQSEKAAAALPGLEQELQRAREYSGQWVQSAPTPGALPGLLGKVHQLARQAEVRLTKVDRLPAVPLGYIQRVPVGLRCVGPFERVFAFLAQQEGLPETVWIEQMKLRASADQPGTVEAEINLGVFANKSGFSGQVDPAS